MATSPSALLANDAQSVFVGYPWEGVARLLDRAPTLHDLRVHRLELLAAARLRERGLEVAPELEAESRRAQIATLAASALLTRVRDVCTGSILLLKGPEVGARYPAPGLRPFGDVDVLVPDADRAQRELQAAGFEGVGEEQDWETMHHLRRLGPPDRLFAVEVHRRPKWVEGVPTPELRELLADAVPSATGTNDVLTPAPPAHAVLLAAHAWAERPLGCIGDLVDVVAMANECPDEAEELARHYGLERVWSATLAAANALFGGGATTWPLRSWARQLPDVRERTVLESHLERLLAPFSALPPVPAVRAAAREVALTVSPARDESWSDKLNRVGRALRNAFVRRSEHERSLRRKDRS